MLGCRGDSVQLELATTADDESAADRAWAELGLRAGRAGRLPEHRRRLRAREELARRVLRRAGPPARRRSGPSRSWSSAGPPNASRRARSSRLAGHPAVVSLADQPLSLGLSKACVRRAALLITTDSGPRHFAAAFQTPVITLFGPTHIAWTRTYHPQALHLFHPVPCGPCQRPVCPEGHHRCMRELTPEQVLQAAFRFLPAVRPDRADRRRTSDRSRRRRWSGRRRRRLFYSETGGEA